jgi:putative nucleotidyltransferase with HDIG domain
MLITVIATLCIAGLFQLTTTGKQDYPEYQLRLGQIAEFDLVAPFDFPIMKTEDQLQQEYLQGLARIGKPYMLSPDVEFEAYSNLDKLFELLFDASTNKDPGAVAINARQQGFRLEYVSPELVGGGGRIGNAYNAIRRALREVYEVGVYEGITADSILVAAGNGYQKRNLSRYFEINEAKRLILAKLEPVQAILVENNWEELILANLVVDAAQYGRLQQEVREKINPIAGMVSQNELVIRKNQRLTEQDINKMNSLAREYKARGERKSLVMQWLSFMGLLLYIFVILFTFNLYFWHTPLRDAHGGASALILNLGYVLLVLMAMITNHWLGLDISLVPFAMVALSVAILVGYDFAYFYAACGTLLLGPFVNWEVFNLALLLLSVLLTIALISRFKSRHEFIRIWIFLYLSVNVINIALTLFSYTGDDLGEKLRSTAANAAYSLVSTTISVLGCFVIVKYFEKRWNRATKQVLLELQDFNHPLLKKLATNAVGTYHHSLIVGNLAERSAEAIGANPLLARVGSYYHDIGKSVNPDIFTENNEESSEFHERYSPEESADIIRDHVKEGVVLAEKYHLPEPLVDIILQHHGTSYIRYFLDAAQRQGEVIDLSAFRYPGPLPQTKEAALVMLADIVESTIKSRSDATEEEIGRIIDETIQRLIREGQFNEAPITLGDLNKARGVMIPILESVYRKRQEYPEENNTGE